MKKLVFIVALLFPSASMATYSGFTYQRVLTINHVQVGTESATYADFPVLVSTTDVTLSTSASGGHLANASAFDMIFSTMNDCSFNLNWDTETFNNTGSTTTNVWVKIPSVSSTTDTTFYLCYGNSAITSYQGNSPATWNSGYVGVFHLASTPTLSGIDATANHADLTPYGTTGLPSASSGTIDGAGFFVAANKHYMQAPGTTYLPLTSAGTISAWVNYATPPDANQYIVDTMHAATTRTGYTFYLYNGRLSVILASDSSAKSLLTSVGTAIAAGGWHHVVAMWNATNIYGFIDGAADSTTAASLTVSGNYVAPYVGGDVSDGGIRFLNGALDQLEFSNVARSGGWIKTEYNNQKTPATFLTIGAETGGGGGAVVPNAFFYGEF